MSAALVLVAIAALLWPGPERALARIGAGRRPSRAASGVVPRVRGGTRPPEPDPFEVAAGYDLLAVCLRAGLPVATAVAVAAAHAPPPLASDLAQAAELLALGADPETAWATPEREGARPRAPDEHFRELATLARRASRAGSSMADGVAALAEATREQARTRALARAERAGVAISGPLGLCFLPAFVCLGIVPVVVGLASGMFGGS
ncbi:type II secretion system F family protein [Gordonia sp. FQ]|uniref:type II secretion system F family protein n=1 Tax=Gordonia sp. FQ TaxID=3446634 RepID=UPI003F854EA1